ncbi:MAG: hypothetical protein NTW03_17420 [Verrucomicrobia bacterium]|nr:hypothetical protein [Verrucomicrobiota bacterium]
MNMKSAALSLSSLTFLSASIVVLPLLAQAGETIDRVMAREGVTWQIQGETTNRLEKELAWPNEIKVLTNGIFQVKGGKERQLQEGQMLGVDGMLISPDGSVVPVMDHLVMKNGQVLMLKDGLSSTLQGDVTLGDGSTVTPDGFYAKPGAARSKLLDGQMFELDGRPIAVRDTVILIGGKVRVQKDGTLLEVPPDRTLMMNDGSKVFGDGTVLMKDGSTKKLTEGVILLIEGVVRKN